MRTREKEHKRQQEIERERVIEKASKRERAREGGGEKREITKEQELAIYPQACCTI